MVQESANSDRDEAEAAILSGREDSGGPDHQLDFSKPAQIQVLRCSICQDPIAFCFHQPLPLFPLYCPNCIVDIGTLAHDLGYTQLPPRSEFLQVRRQRNNYPDFHKKAWQNYCQWSEVLMNIRYSRLKD